MFLTLLITTLLYVTVVWIALVSVGRAELAQSSAPLALVFERLTGASPRTMSFIAVVATLRINAREMYWAMVRLVGGSERHDSAAIRM